MNLTDFQLLQPLHNRTQYDTWLPNTRTFQDWHAMHLWHHRTQEATLVCILLGHKHQTQNLTAAKLFANCSMQQSHQGMSSDSGSMLSWLAHYMYIYAYLHAHIYIHITYTYIRVYQHTYIHMWRYRHTHAHTCTRTHTCMCANTTLGVYLCFSCWVRAAMS